MIFAERCKMTPSTFYWLLCLLSMFYAVKAEKYTDCEFPPSVNYATAKLVVENDNIVQAIYTCDNGYELEGPEQLICDIDADEWNTDPPICVSNTEVQAAENNEPKRKKKLNDIPEDRAVPADMAASLDMSCAEAKLKAPDVKNGFVQKYERRRRNQHIFLAAIFSCNEGFELEDMDVATLYCSQQRWIGSLPTCLSLSDYDYEEYEEEQNNEEKATDTNDADAEHDNDNENEEVDYNEEEPPAAVAEPEKTKPTAEEVDEQHETVPVPLEVEKEEEAAETDIENSATAATANADVDNVENVTQDPYAPRLLDNECGANNAGCEQICERVLFPGENEPRLRCACHAGFSLDPYNYTACHDIDECQIHNGGCEQICHNTPGSFECGCEEGLKIDENDSTHCIDIDECQSEDIVAQCAGSCVNTHGSYSCTPITADSAKEAAAEENVEEDEKQKCTAGYEWSEESQNCVDIDECANEARNCAYDCQNTAGSYSCICPEGQHLSADGHSCEADTCADLFTYNKDKCAYLCEDLPNAAGHLCTCPANYQLAEDLHNCVVADHPCSEHGGYNACAPGQCLASDSNEGGFICECPAGYERSAAGTSCQDIDECLAGSHECSHACFNTAGSYECSCPGGYTLKPNNNYECEDIDECLSKPNLCGALNCINLQGTFQCQCANGASPHAETGLCADESSPCAHDNNGCNQICELDGSCACQQGFTLADDGKICEDVNECLLNNGGCQQLCSNYNGSFVCACEFGFELDQDQQSCIDIDECAKGTHQCSHECKNTEGGYLCLCPNGYFLDNRVLSCLDVDECSDGTHECSHQCVNTDGSYVCTCPEGFELHADSHTCVELRATNRCALNNGGCSHECNNEGGCSCPDGYRLASDNSTCVDLDECAVNNGGCSHLCVNRPIGYECHCPPGFKLSETDALTCMDIDECLAPHICEHECVNTNGSYACKCPQGYELHNRRFCKDINECEINNGACIGGECINHNGGHECRCPAGQRLAIDGRTCESRQDLRDQCPPFVAPMNGEIHCTKYRHKKKLFYNTRCNVWCNPGYKLVGSARRYCNATGLWDNNESRCLPIVCPRLPPARNGLILPTSCTLGKVYMGEWCRIQCQPGFVPAQRPATVCTARGIWNHNATLECIPGKFTLLDPRSNGVLGKEPTTHKTSRYPFTPKTTHGVSEPFIKCPRNTTVLLNKGEKTVFIKLHKPVTNLDYRLIESHPAWAKKLQAHLPAGKYVLNFRGRVPETGKLIGCQTVIVIRRSAAPRINYCTQPFEVTLSPNQAYRSITWEEPRFQVSSGSLKKIIRSRIPGELFGLGEHSVYYEASNEDGLTSRCEFKIYVKAAPITPLPLMPAVDLDFSNNIVPARVPVRDQKNAATATAQLLAGHESYIMCPGQAPVKVNKPQVEFPANCYIKNVRINHNRHLMRLFRSKQWLPFSHF